VDQTAEWVLETQPVIPAARNFGDWGTPRASALTILVELLVRIVGSDRCMFGTENPGTGSYKDPQSGKMLDDLKPVIEGISTVTEQDRKNIFEDVAKKVFPRFKV